MRKLLRFALLGTVVVFAIASNIQCVTRSTGPSATYNVVVYGGTSASVAAAVQAKRMGKTVVIVCPEKHLGGLSAGGLGWTDSGRKDAVGGISREFYRRVKAHYDRSEAWVHQKPE